jgi:hypothetical protein
MGKVGGHEDGGHTRGTERPAHVDGADDGVSVGAADEDGLKRPIDTKVREVLTPAAEQSSVLQAR